MPYYSLFSSYFIPHIVTIGVVFDFSFKPHFITILIFLLGPCTSYSHTNLAASLRSSSLVLELYLISLRSNIRYDVLTQIDFIWGKMFQINIIRNFWHQISRRPNSIHEFDTFLLFFITILIFKYLLYSRLAVAQSNWPAVRNRFAKIRNIWR